MKLAREILKETYRIGDGKYMLLKSGDIIRVTDHLKWAIGNPLKDTGWTLRSLRDSEAGEHIYKELERLGIYTLVVDEYSSRIFIRCYPGSVQPSSTQLKALRVMAERLWEKTGETVKVIPDDSESPALITFPE